MYYTIVEVESRHQSCLYNYLMTIVYLLFKLYLNNSGCHQTL